MVCDRAFNKSFCKNLESVQYKPAIAITGAIRIYTILHCNNTSSRKLFREFGLESLKLRSWLRFFVYLTNI